MELGVLGLTIAIIGAIVSVTTLTISPKIRIFCIRGTATSNSCQLE